MISDNPMVRNALFYFSAAMITVYTLVGFAICFTTFLIEMIPNNRTIIGGILIIYGGFRMYMLYRQKKSYKFFQQQKQENNNQNVGVQ